MGSCLIRTGFEATLRPMNRFATAFLIFLGCTSMVRAVEPVSVSPVEPASVSPAVAVAWLTATPAAQVLDVRTKEEFAGGHLARATVIPWTDKNFSARAAKELDLHKPVLVYCGSGRRSTQAAAALTKLGFTEVRNLEGGILAWQQAGKPICKPEPTPKP